MPISTIVDFSFVQNKVPLPFSPIDPRQMDPSTIVVNTAALINTTAKVIGYLSSVLDASNDRQVMLLELCNSCHVLYTLQKHAKAEPSSLPNSLIFSTAQGPLQHLKRTLESLVDVMEPSKNRNKILSAFAWPLKKDEIHKILKTLEHQKSLIIMALQAEQGYVPGHLTRSVNWLINVQAAFEGNTKRCGSSWRSNGRHE